MPRLRPLVAAGLACLLLPALSGCSLQKLAIRSTGRMLDGGFASMMAEDDLVLAKTALESNLKLVEGLIRSDPENERLLLLAAQGFTAYALGFVEDDDPARAVKLYLRGRRYAERWVERKTGVALTEIQRLDRFEAAVAALPPQALPGVFWLGNAWASAAMLRLDDVASISDLPKIETLMRFVLDHDEGFYYGSAHLFFAGYYGGRPRMLGGDPEAARAHLDRQRELTGGRFLLTELFRVKYVAMPSLDEEATRATLEHILTFDLDSAPDLRLVNRVTQRKARRLLDSLDDYF